MGDVSPTPILPLQLIPSEIIPPSPNSSENGPTAAVDWLPDFSGHSWIAYGASSLLVISHFPSPHYSLSVPVFRQVFHLSSPLTGDVSGVNWSPASPSSGDLAACAGDRIFIFEYSLGSFCWSQTALLLQSSKVDAIAWTGSGDGIVSGGTEVLLWKRNITSWEIAWKFRMKAPQILLSTSSSLEGPSACAAYPIKCTAEGSSSVTCDASYCVSVFQSNGKSEYVTTELHHPQPVLALQWRPSAGGQLRRDTSYAHVHVLLTSCLDGAVRLWSEIDGSKNRKSNKDNCESLPSRRSFCVVAVIEVNQLLDGTLGTNVFVNWALEMECLSCMSGEDDKLLSLHGYRNDEVGRCEWLIGYGPGKMLSFWAVHCLDDNATMRSPRVTLWKRVEIRGIASENVCGNDHLFGVEGFHFQKAALWRNQMFGPPNVISLFQLLPSKSFALSLLHGRTYVNEEGDEFSNKNEIHSPLSGYSERVLDTFGHTGKILRVSVHPSKSEVQCAVSLDSNGLLIFWSILINPDSISSFPVLHPSWKLIGKTTLPNTDTRLYWVPSLVDKDRILLIAHKQGIDILIIRSCETKGEKLLCKKLCTIPFAGDAQMDLPDDMIAVPLQSTARSTPTHVQFLVLVVWKNCKVESLKVTLHFNELTESCPLCNFRSKGGENSSWACRVDFGGKPCSVAVDRCSSYLPDVHDEVTSIAMVSPTTSTLSLLLKLDQVDGSLNNLPYHLGTGHSDGRSRFWRINLCETPVTHLSIELVGMVSTLLGPVNTIAVADSGQKVATICSDGQTNNEDMLCIWGTLHLEGTGTFELEDKICLKGIVVSLHWFCMQRMLFLGVCFQNEMHIYCQRVCAMQTMSTIGKSSKESIWVCIAKLRTSPTIRDFILGPKETIIIIYEKFFGLFSQWSFGGDLTFDCAMSLPSVMDKDNAAFFTPKVHKYEELVLEKSNQGSSLIQPLTKAHNDIPGCLPAYDIQSFENVGNKIRFVKLTEVAEKICGPLHFYDLDVLVMNIYSGNWKRAYVAVCHLFQYLSSDSAIHQRLSPTKSSVAIRQVKLSDYYEGKLPHEVSKGFDVSKDLNTITWSSHSEGGFMQFNDDVGHNASNSLFFVSSANSKSRGSDELMEKLRMFDYLTDTEKKKMCAIINLLCEISDSQSPSAYESLDEPGQRFWCAIRLQQLEYRESNGRMPLVKELVVDSMLIGWAFYSDCQANLFDAFLSAEPSWEEMRKLGVGFWFTNLTDLRTKMEKLARQQYLKSKDPKACALLYIALNRLQVLAGLFKVSKDERDKPLVAFLSRNFQEEKNKSAALKNAYVLMGRHQFELAIAFFLLGGDITSAITVCAKNLGDPQLALVICRLIEGQRGPSEHHLISKILLPSAIEEDDYWLASILEWMLGNYLQSFLIVLGLHGDSNTSKPEKKSFRRAAFVNPFIGMYCRMLAGKNSLRNAVGEQASSILCRWAAVMTVSAFTKCSLPLEALEWISSSSTILGVADKGTYSRCLDILPKILLPFTTDSTRWLSHDVACNLEYKVKLDLALQYVMIVMKEHPCWVDSDLLLTEVIAFPKEREDSDFSVLLEDFVQKLGSVLMYLDQKFSLSGDLLLNKIFASLDDDRWFLIEYHLVNTLPSQVCPYTLTCIGSKSHLLQEFKNATQCLSYSVAQFITANSIASSQSVPLSEHDNSAILCWDIYLLNIIVSICQLRSVLMVLHIGRLKHLIPEFIIILRLCEYCLCFSSAMLQRNIKCLAVLLRPLLASYGDINHVDFNNTAILSRVLEALGLSSWTVSAFEGLLMTKRNALNRTFSFPEDEKWMILVTSLWQCFSKSIKYELDQLLKKLDSNNIGDTSTSDSSLSFWLDGNDTLEYVKQVMVIFTQTISNTLTDVSSHSAKQLCIFLRHEVENGMVPNQIWLDEYSKSQSSTLYEHLGRIFTSSEELNDNTSCYELIAKMSNDPMMVSAMVAQLPIKLSQLTRWNPIRGWSHLNKGELEEHGRLESYKREGVFDSSPRASDTGSPVGSEHDLDDLGSVNKEAASSKKIVPFRNPTEIYRRNGEMFEALCINSIEQRQAAVASPRKGICFFDWGDIHSSKDPSNYIWSKAEWPQYGWGGSTSTLVHSRVSPCIGLTTGEKLRLGLGGNSGGVGSHTRVGRGIGWGIQEDLDNIIDPPATLDNTNASAMASHPSRPTFLVGSSNTHIYLWEFGEEKAAATYGVLPAANIPPPYPLASITSLQWDRCGHRFANSASDGTVCTWQLSNVKPTESSLCFNGHASDICYVAPSGSIISAAGYSSDGVNVVIWDTLAPPTSSRASVMCHEGGACSIAVFDKDMGTSSVSPLIVTGGKGGDVGLHDFRYIATGKTKRHRHSNAVDRVTDVAALGLQSENSSNVGDLNRHGMLWYIPNAHSGSVTKIATIPNTSLFLTGSKDGDVKLWDAKKARLVFQWPRLHERHTFLQRTSQSFGGVTRVGVTDIQVISKGFVTCGGDGLVKLIQLNDFL